MKDQPILLVEDSPDDVFFMKRAFQACVIDNPIHVSTDGVAAIEYLSGEGEFADRTKHPLPCIVLLDLKLPRKNGHEVLRWIRADERVKTLVVIILTTSREPRDIQQAYLAGCNAFLVKPSAPPELTEIVCALKNFWFPYNVFPQ